MENDKMNQNRTRNKIDLARATCQNDTEDKSIKISKLLLKILSKQNELYLRERVALRSGDYGELKRLEDWNANLHKREENLDGLFEQAYQKSMSEDSDYFGGSN